MIQYSSTPRDNKGGNWGVTNSWNYTAKLLTGEGPLHDTDLLRELSGTEMELEPVRDGLDWVSLVTYCEITASEIGYISPVM